MITHILQHEIRKYFSDGRSRVLFLTVLATLIASLVLSLRDFQLVSQQYEQNLRQVRINWEQQSEKDPHDAAHDGTYVIRPLHPLAMIDKGIQPFTGKVVHLGAHKRNQSTLNEAKDQSGVFRFGELTPGFMLIYIIPLLLIFLGFDAFTKEKENQTLRLLLVQGTTRRKLAQGKWLALFIQMFILWLLLFAAVISGTVFLVDDVQLSALEAVSLSLTYLLYLTIFLNVVIWVSSKASSSGVALTILISFWIIFTLIVPKVATNLAGWTHPFPTLQTFKENINKDQASGLNGHNFWNDAAKDFKQKVLQEYGVEKIEDLPVDFGGLLLAEGEKYESEIFTKHFNLLQNQYKKQRSVYQWCSLLSPMLPVRFISMGISRTGYGFLWHFEDEAEKYRVEFNTDLNMNIAENAKGVDKYTAGGELWASISGFNYKWQQDKEILNDHAIELIVLFLWTVFSFFIAIYSSQKIKVV